MLLRFESAQPQPVCHPHHPGTPSRQPLVLESEHFPCPVSDSNRQQENSAPQISSSECSPGHFPAVGREIKVLITRFPPFQHLLAARPRVEISGDASLRGPCPAIAPSLIPAPRQPQPPTILSPLFSRPYFPHLHPITGLRISQVPYSRLSAQPVSAHRSEALLRTNHKWSFI